MHPKTNKYWAWEFLRRNHVYREAYAAVGSLSKEEKSSLDGAAHSLTLLGSLVPTLPFRLFDSDLDFDHFLSDDQTTKDLLLDDFSDHSVSQVEALLTADARHETLVSLKDKFSRESYLLKEWIAPTTPASELSEEIFLLKAVEARGLNEKITPEGARDNWDDGTSIPLLLPGETMWPFGLHKVVDFRRVYDGKKHLRPKQTFDGYQGKDGKYFDRQNCASFSMCITDMVFKIQLALPLEPQLIELQKSASRQLAVLTDAGVCEELKAEGDSNGLYADYLIILDGLDQNLKPEEIAETVGLATLNRTTGVYHAEGFPWNKAPAARDRVRKMISRARSLRDYGYLNLALYERPN